MNLTNIPHRTIRDFRTDLLLKCQRKPSTRLLRLYSAAVIHCAWLVTYSDGKLQTKCQLSSHNLFLKCYLKCQKHFKGNSNNKCSSRMRMNNRKLPISLFLSKIEKQNRKLIKKIPSRCPFWCYCQRFQNRISL